MMRTETNGMGTPNDGKKVADIERDGNSPNTGKAHDGAGAFSNSDGGEKTNDVDTPSDDVNVDEENQASTSPPPEKEPEEGRTLWQTVAIMSALCSALFLAALDITIITTAIPTIVRELQAPSGYTWIGAAYLLANSATVPSWGKLSDIWGRKPVLLTAVAIFWIGSLISALAVNIAMLIAGRAVQGAGGGGIVVLTNIIVGDLFSVRKRGLYYGVFGAVWSIASAIGPILGGVFTSLVSWRWCFYVNLPISGLGFFLLLFVLKLHNPRTPVRAGLMAIDWLGSLLIIGGTLMLLFGLNFGGVTFPWNSATVISLIVFGVFVIALFVLVECHVAKYPVIPIRLFRNRSNIFAFVISFIHGAVFISASYYLPLYFQAVLGASSLLSGVYLLPYVLILSIVSTVTGVWMKKTGKYLWSIMFGMFFLTLGFGLMTNLPVQPGWEKIILYQVIAGIGVGPNFQSPLIALQSTVEPRDIASATGTFQFVRQLATSASVVIGGVIFQNGMETRRPELVAQLGPDLADRLTSGNAGGSVELVASLQGAQALAAKSAYNSSLMEMWILYATLAGVGLLLSPLIGQGKLSNKHTEHQTGLNTLRKREESSAQAPTEEPT